MRRRSKAPERDEIQVRSREHHLNPDQNENRVPPTQDRKQADGKQRRGNDEEVLKCWCHDAVYLAFGERTPPACWRSALGDRELSFSHRKQTTRRGSSFSQDAETSTVQPCAPQAPDSAFTFFPPSPAQAHRSERRSGEARRIATATHNPSLMPGRFA